MYSVLHRLGQPDPQHVPQASQLLHYLQEVRLPNGVSNTSLGSVLPSPVGPT